jgi:hypothetical protein
MNTSKSLLLAVVLFAGFILFRSPAQDHTPQAAAGAYEYTTIRWAGKDNTHLIRPGGKVAFIGTELRKLVRPDRADERSFYMNAAMNGLSKEGYEFAGMTNDEIVMKRAAAR